MRRSLVLLVLGAALAAALPAAAQFQPVRRGFGEASYPRVRVGTITIPAGHRAGRVRVIVELGLPPLAASSGRGLYSAGSARRLDVHAAASRAYLRRLVAAQNAAIAELRRAIPQARVSWRYQVILDGFTVSVPAIKLPALVRLGFVQKIYPSLAYTMELNRSPSIIGADVLHATTGAKGDGIKIGVVDDGVDPRNPFFNPAGYQYPPGFPKGGTKWTTPKIIVARTFPGPNSGAPGRLAVDPNSSFHGTHVAGIAAGDEGTTAPAGPDHPLTTGLSGVAPRAYIGNYRVFTVPTPIGHVANTPEIVAAFESAVLDGMDVINFSGGGPAGDPVNDALIEAMQNVAAAGVLPVIAAGNDRDDFGYGTVGSPGSAPAALTVAAVSNVHVYSPALSVTSPGAPDLLKQMPFQPAGGTKVPPAWGTIDQTLVDVGSVAGNGGTPVDRYLCGPADDPNNPNLTDLPAHSLDGTIALVSRGYCTFFSKALRAAAAGAVGMIFVDNRPGEASPVPIPLPLPAGMVADLDGANLRAFLAQSGGRAPIRVDSGPFENVTGRSGIVTSFSSAGPTAFQHLLKPDLAAPGGQILSSTLPEFAGSNFAVFDGTSMATPHATGAAALLIQLDRSWTPQQIKSALVATAGPAWGNTARTQEAPVLLEGGGLISLPAANDPQIFTDPVSLSYGELNIRRGAASHGLLVRLSDAGDGAGTWSATLAPQAATAGVTIDVPSLVVVPPGGEVDLGVVVRAGAAAAPGENYGFVLLHRGSVTRRIPYDVLVAKPALQAYQPIELKRFQAGNTAIGSDLVHVYCCPSAPFGLPPSYTGTPMNESGAEHVYVTHLNDTAANIGVSLVFTSAGAQIDPWFLNSLDENDVAGYAGTPVDVNALTFDFKADVGAAGAVFPRQQEFFVAVDSGSDIFTGKPFAGQYVLRSWVNDVTPPAARIVSARVSAGHPTLVARILDAQSGVDPLSLAIGYQHILVGAAAYDPISGYALFPLPAQAKTLQRGHTTGVLMASDYQESKNIETEGANIFPNTTFLPIRLTVVRGPAVTWLEPESGACVPGRARLLVTASSTARITAVRFFDGRHSIATGTGRTAGLYSADWAAVRARRGTHLLRAVARDSAGRSYASARRVRICR